MSSAPHKSRPAAPFIDGEQIIRLTTVEQLIPAVRDAFLGPAAPARAHHHLSVPGGTDGTLLIMPAWRTGRRIGVKLATVFPDNPGRALPSVTAQYLLLSAVTGQLEAILDGTTLTLLRTAAVSGVACDALARSDAASLLMVGTGALIPWLVDAHRSVRQIRSVAVWGRNPDRALESVSSLASRGFEATVCEELQRGVEAADIVSCATMSEVPLVLGRWIRPGTHVDLVGSFRPAMRETDDDLFVLAGAVVVDTLQATSESGDLIGPLQSGRIAIDDVRCLADVLDMTPGPADPRRITVFKSVGTAIADLAAAEVVYDSLIQRTGN